MIFNIRFSPRPFLLFCLLFVIELLIALFLNDQIIRPLVGDVLVVGLIFYFVKAFVDCSDFYLALGTLLFAYAVEVAQYFDFVTLLGLGDYEVARVVLGTSFDWRDLVAYTIGAVLVFYGERWYCSRSKFQTKREVN